MRLFSGVLVGFCLFFVGCGESNGSGVRTYADLSSANFPNLALQHNDVIYHVHYDGISYADAESFYGNLSLKHGYNCSQADSADDLSCEGDTFIYFTDTNKTAVRREWRISESANVSSFAIDNIFPADSKKQQIKYKVEKCYTNATRQLDNYYNDLIENRGFVPVDNRYAIKIVDDKIYEFTYVSDLQYSFNEGIFYNGNGARWIITDAYAFLEYGYNYDIVLPICTEGLMIDLAWPPL
ncbi:MAG: hypothetical protein LBQ18_06005 [Campylobacteraceae bacterium]|jgi:hypothetical protein|nr:hypothetical protein [Campylobacteraceae bacterium]